MSHMNKLSAMPPVGLVVIVAIVSLFVLALLVLFITYARYSRLASLVGNLKRENSFLRFVVNDFADAYKRHGSDVNTPAIIANGVSTKLGGSLLCERFLNNAVSLFVTLGHGVIGFIDDYIKVVKKRNLGRPSG